MNNSLIIKQVLNTIASLPDKDIDGWVDYAKVGLALAQQDINYRVLGYEKLGEFLASFSDYLEYNSTQPEGLNKTPVKHLRIKKDVELDSITFTESNVSFIINSKFPKEEDPMHSWAFIDSYRIADLKNLALPEKWYYGTVQPNGIQDTPILRKYLEYTFKRLAYEKKIIIHDEYAAFNTGLVDNKYEYIYALFEKNRKTHPYWYLKGFVIPGEDMGKLLVKEFNPLPAKADYFEGKVENMLYDTSTGELSYDYTHILTEHMERLPVDLLCNNCPREFLTIDGVFVRDIVNKPISDKISFFNKLGENLRNDSKTLNRLKNRLDDAVKMAKKRVEWNYKTAIPMYYAPRHKCSLLLPLALVDEDTVDVALVVERQPSGAYLGHTILPLSWAYSNSRLVSRPDSDWLNTESVTTDVLSTDVSDALSDEL